LSNKKVHSSRREHKCNFDGCPVLYTIACLGRITKKNNIPLVAKPFESHLLIYIGIDNEHLDEAEHMYNLHALGREIALMFSGHLGFRFNLKRDKNGNLDSVYHLGSVPISSNSINNIKFGGRSLPEMNLFKMMYKDTGKDFIPKEYATHLENTLKEMKDEMNVGNEIDNEKYAA
jgi:hypothetical protein